jgi:hypothetical protein
MDNGRILRAVVTGITLLLTLWVLQRLNSHRIPPADLRTESQPSAPAPAPVPTQHPTPAPVDTLPPVAISALPLVSMDNTCFSGSSADLSCYTGMLSGGPARSYAVHAESGKPLQITVQPEDEHYDVSLALFKDGRCLTGRDDKGAGQSEQVVLPEAKSGLYTLVVGGYSDNCGPYTLTVRNDPPAVAEMQDATAHTGPNGTVIRWQSFGEVALSNFSVYRLSDGQRERIAVLRAHGTPAGFASYRYTDRSPRSECRYEVEAVTRDGRSEIVSVLS